MLRLGRAPLAGVEHGKAEQQPAAGRNWAWEGSTMEQAKGKNRTHRRRCDSAASLLSPIFPKIKEATLWLYGGLEIGYQRGRTRHALAAFGADTA
jgi:hypothetical protein